MKKFRTSLIFLVAIILVILAYVTMRYYSKEGLVSSSLLSPAPILLKNLSYMSADKVVNTMTAHRVWRDVHQSSTGQQEIWLWEEDVSTDNNSIQMKAISPAHLGQTLELNITNKKYIWNSPGNPVYIFDIAQSS